MNSKNGLSSSPKLCSLRSKRSISVSIKFLLPVMQSFLLLISKQLADYVAIVALAIDGYFFQSCNDVTSSRWEWVGARVLYFVGVWVRTELGMLCMRLVGIFSNLLRICHSRGLLSKQNLATKETFH